MRFAVSTGIISARSGLIPGYGPIQFYELISVKDGIQPRAETGQVFNYTGMHIPPGHLLVVDEVDGREFVISSDTVPLH